MMLPVHWYVRRATVTHTYDTTHWYGCLKKTSAHASLGHAIQRQTLLSIPWFDALDAYLPRYPLLRRGVSFSKTPVMAPLLSAFRLNFARSAGRDREMWSLGWSSRPSRPFSVSRFAVLPCWHCSWSIAFLLPLHRFSQHTVSESNYVAFCIAGRAKMWSSLVWSHLFSSSKLVECQVLDLLEVIDILS